MAERILMNEYKALSQETWVNVDLDKDNILAWEIALIVINPDSLYYGGYFRAEMKFPANYPYSPPSFRFRRPLYHPNIYPDGKLCISILHTPGDDEMSGETAGERWSPVQRVESVLLSIISLLDDAECSSPANVDAGVMLRKQPAEFRVKVAADVEASKQDIPAGFVMPTHESTVEKPTVVKDDDPDFWVDSDNEEEGFGGSDTEAEEAESGDDDDEMQERESDNEEEEDGDQDMTGTEDNEEEDEDSTLH
ncbi:ubiquitin conjugating enzyme [Physcia stellaris]|nr:ubiquitin conjugating enzyme [Physcia stellaris]